MIFEIKMYQNHTEVIFDGTDVVIGSKYWPN